MKKKVLLFIYFMSFVVFSQQKTFQIDWNGFQKLGNESFSIEVPSFNKEYFSFDTDTGLLFISQWESNSSIDETSAVLSNVQYEAISTADLKDLDPSKIPNKLVYKIKNSEARNKQYIYFQLTPIIKDSNGSFKKVTSFTVNYSNSRINSRTAVQTNKLNLAVSNSVLGSGEWYKFYIDTTGVFKLSRNFLQQLGVNVNSVDPRNIKLYGNGGDMIPYSNSVDYPIDIQENAIKIVGEEDGTFNNEDYILFYGVGPKGFQAESNTNINCYTDKTHYFINVANGPGKRIQPFAQPTGTVDLNITTYQDYQFYEKDEYNIASLGRRWFGDRFDVENDKTFDFDFPGLVTSEPISLKVYVAAVSSSSSSMQISVNNTNVSTLSISGASTPIVAREASYSGNINVNSFTISVNLNFDNIGNPSALGYLDYISIEATRDLNFTGKQFQFKNNVVALTSGIGEYTISNASELSEIWDITDIYNISNFDNTDAVSNLTFTSTLGIPKHFVAVSSDDYFEPQRETNTTVNNQDIKGTIFSNNQGEFVDVDYIIVAPGNMLAQAERLAEINRNQYQLNVKVVLLDEIYNEFSTGNQDVGAIRNMVKYVYDISTSSEFEWSENKFKYLCFFGDSSFDYKDRINNNTNIVPSWHAYNSFSYTSSYVSDDFFGMMGPTEGTMVNSDKLDIAVGRILADTPQRAKELVDKIESYYRKESYGSWRNNFVVVSDDVDEDWEGILQETTDNVGNQVTQNKTFMNVVKIHSDSFRQESSAGGDSYPQVNTEFANAVDKGALVINYFGHGGEDGLASERILLKPDILAFRNFLKLNCFVTVTCEFTRFDNPLRETAGEFAYWNKDAGAISLITTTRQVFVTTGITLNNELGKYLFSFNPDDDYDDYEYPSMAEALRLTKIDPAVSNISQRRLMFFIGDPAMKLAFAKPNVKLTKINDVSIQQVTDTLKALSYIKLAGEVTDRFGNVINDYNGTVLTTIYDKEIDRQTLANDGTRLNGQLIKLDYKTLGAVIFRGEATVSNGLFEVDFVVPKDVGVPVGFGKVSFYAENGSSLDDETGANLNTVKIGGINENAPVDDVGPLISLYMNDESFVSGGITNESPILLVKLEDFNGINTASGIGHDIVAILDGDETNPFILNDYYQTELDNYQKGVISFPFRDLEPGLHTLTIKAWDVYNNSSTAEIQFIVYNQNQELVINNVLNYPNPFVNYTEFWFNHNSSDPLDVSIQIFTVSGKLVRTLNGQTSSGIYNTSSLSRDIVWDGRDDFGDKIGKGVYIYKLTVRSSLLNKTVEKIEKLVIL